MFYETLHFTDNKVMKGKVLGFELDRIGLVRSGRSINAYISEWDDCVPTVTHFLDTPKTAMEHQSWIQALH